MQTSFWAVLVLAALSLNGCSEEPMPQPPVSQASGGSPVQLAHRMSWPPIESGEKQGQESIQLADNILARNYYVVLDASSSMDERACGGSGNKISVAKTATVEFVGALRDDDNIGLLVFDGSGVSERVPLGFGAAHKTRVVSTIQKIRTGNGTPLHDAVTRGYRQLMAQAHRQLGYGLYTLVVVTDGEANAGQDPGGIVEHITSFSSVGVKTLGFCIGEKHSLNRPGLTVYVEARDLPSLRRGFQEVLAEAPTFDVAEFRK
ncbi:VWA domain-containing protein [Candidatus Parcubacteria bacterium]|nr:VWA domain-containing protein [Candidatus Parcubacteria bacterium]